MKTYLLIYIVSVALSLVFTAAALWLGRKLGLTDEPHVRKVHEKPVPRIGGLGIFVTVLCIMMIPAFSGTVPMASTSGQALTTIHLLIWAATIVFLLGLADDVKALRAHLKLFVQLAAGMLVCAGGIRVESIAVGEWSGVNLHGLAWPMTLLWIVGITNAVNLSDGLDGLATTLSMIACAVIAVLALQSDQVLLAVLMFTLLGALTGFLGFNFHPARIFLGDSGSLFVGFLIAASSVLCFRQSKAFTNLALPFVALGIPITDTVLSVFRRFLARRPIFAPDRGHFHHRLLQFGLGQRWVVGLVCVSTLIVTGLGMSMLLVQAWVRLIIFAGILVVLYAQFHLVGIVRCRKIVAGLKNRFYHTRQVREEIGEFCNLQIRFEHAHCLGTWWEALCSTADRLDFAWASVDLTDHEGDVNTYLWRRPGPLPMSTRLTLIKVPIHTQAPGQSIEVEVAVLTNGSAEGAIRRASLFGRLLDEYKMPVPGDAVGQFTDDNHSASVRANGLSPACPRLPGRLNAASDVRVLPSRR